MLARVRPNVKSIVLMILSEVPLSEGAAALKRLSALVGTLRETDRSTASLTRPL